MRERESARVALRMLRQERFFESLAVLGKFLDVYPSNYKHLDSYKHLLDEDKTVIVRLRALNLTLGAKPR